MTRGRQLTLLDALKQYEQEGRCFTLPELAAATGYKLSSVKTYHAKRFRDRLVFEAEGGTLQARERASSFESTGSPRLTEPTYVNGPGKAVFSNMMLSDWDEPYSPRLRPEFMDIYTAAYKDRNLSLPRLESMSKMLCDQDV